MPALLVLAIVGVTLLEVVVLVQVGQAIGTAWTITLIIAAAVLGGWLLRREGRRAWAQFRDALAGGRWPGDEVTQGALVLVGGALLFTPGFVTDVVGFLLLFAPTRVLVSRLIRARVRAGTIRVGGRGGGRAAQGREHHEHADALGIEVVEIERDDRHETPSVADEPQETDDEDPPRPTA